MLRAVASETTLEGDGKSTVDISARSLARTRGLVMTCSIVDRITVAVVSDPATLEINVNICGE